MQTHYFCFFRLPKVDHFPLFHEESANGYNSNDVTLGLTRNSSTVSIEVFITNKNDSDIYLKCGFLSGLYFHDTLFSTYFSVTALCYRIFLSLVSFYL